MSRSGDTVGRAYSRLQPGLPLLHFFSLLFVPSLFVKGLEKMKEVKIIKKSPSLLKESPPLSPSKISFTFY